MFSGGASMVAIGDGFFVEPYMLDITRNDIATASNAQSEEILVAQITDIHLRKYKSHDKKVISELFSMNPDIILLTGDIIDDYKNMSVLNEFIWDLPDSSQKYAVLGNWEYQGGLHIPTLRSMYEKAGIRLLVNETVTSTIRDKSFLITGMDDYVKGKPDLRKSLENTPPSPNHLLVVHAPGFRDEVDQMIKDASQPWVNRYHFQAILSGHSHGGQVTIFGFAPILPRGAHRYTAGWYDEKGIPLYVCRGIASTGIPVRFMCPPELATFSWHLV